MFSLNEPKKWNQPTSMGHLKVRLIKFVIVGLRGFFIQRLIQHEIRGLLCSLFCHGLIVCTVENRGTPEWVCMGTGTCQGPQYPRPTETEKHFPWTLRGCHCMQKTSTESCLLQESLDIDTPYLKMVFPLLPEGQGKEHVRLFPDQPTMSLPAEIWTLAKKRVDDSHSSFLSHWKAQSAAGHCYLLHNEMTDQVMQSWPSLHYWWF